MWRSVSVPDTAPAVGMRHPGPTLPSSGNAAGFEDGLLPDLPMLAGQIAALLREAGDAP
jgi:hypothetical protein